MISVSHVNLRISAETSWLPVDTYCLAENEASYSFVLSLYSQISSCTYWKYGHTNRWRIQKHDRIQKGNGRKHVKKRKKGLGLVFWILFFYWYPPCKEIQLQILSQKCIQCRCRGLFPPFGRVSGSYSVYNCIQSYTVWKCFDWLVHHFYTKINAYIHFLNTGESTTNRWFTLLPLPVDQFSRLFFFLVCHIKHHKQAGGQGAAGWRAGQEWSWKPAGSLPVVLLCLAVQKDPNDARAGRLYSEEKRNLNPNKLNR